jgi:ribonuclease HI
MNKIIFAGIVRRLWSRRNEYVHEGKFIHPNSIVQQAMTSLTEFKEATAHDLPPSHDNEATDRWSIPVQGCMKVNWDTSICSQRGLVGVGIVCRNHLGEVLGVQRKIVEGFFDPLVAEAWAGGRVIQFGMELGFTHIVLEGDSKLVVDAINAEGPSWSKIGHLVEDIQILLQNFQQWKVQAIRRSANTAAHTIARMAIRDHVVRTWRARYPECIHDIILEEEVSPSID